MATLATVAAFGFSDFDPSEMLAIYRRFGCMRCQFYRNEDNPPSVDEAIRITRDAGLPIDSIHGVFGDEYDPAIPDESARKRMVEVYRREGELAAALGGPRVVVHPSVPAPPGHVITGQERHERVGPLRRSMEDLAEIGEALGVVYLFENNPANHFIGHDPLQIAAMVRALNHPNVRMCFDTGHAQMTGTVADRLEQCADVIGYLHVHDNDGQVDDHRMPGDGQADWEAIREALLKTKLDVSAMLEVFYLADRLRQLLSTDRPDRVARWLAADAAGASIVGEEPGGASG